MKKSVLIFLLFLLISKANAKITLSPLFSDNMVLQQQSEVPVWGKANPGKVVKLVTSWDNKSYNNLSDSDGNWKITISTPVAGGPYSISVSDGKELKINNVLIGEVWICSGQSNMEMPLAGWGQVLNYKQEIEDANYPLIRLLHVDQVTSSQPQSDLKVSKGGWQVCSPASIADFSSVAYFFGRNLHQNMNNIPIGLINTSWGGTIAEAWTSGKTLENMPYFRESVKEINSIDQTSYIEDYNRKKQIWDTELIEADKGFFNGQPEWASLEYKDTDWKNMKLPVLWEESGLEDFDGIVWFRKEINIPSDWSGKELELSFPAIDDSDITYFNGKEIGSTSGYNQRRIYKIPGKIVKSGKSVITVRVTDTGGGGGIYGDPSEMYIALRKGNNFSSLSLAGSDANWKYKIAVNLKEFRSAPGSPYDPNRPTVLYNAMIHPIVPYTISGAIWYQGESNANRAYQYRELFPLMIRDWRKQWGYDFPFYFVQLANFMKMKDEPGESEWAELREAQLMTLDLKNTGMAVTIDIGDADDIHPKNKQDVGTRLALAARANTYGQNIPYSGPVYQSYKIEQNKIRIYFKNTDDGLKAKDGALKGFAIAGPDHQFYWAKAEIEGNTIVVSSPDVPYPIAVRYAWADNPDCNLYNEAGLPASPFRTDDWIRGESGKE